MELERNRISFTLLEASMTFARKSSLRSHLTAEVAEFFSQAFREKKKITKLLQKEALLRKCLVSPYVANASLYPLYTAPLKLFQPGEGVQSSANTKSEELRFEVRMLSKSSSLYPPGGWGSGGAS